MIFLPLAFIEYRRLKNVFTARRPSRNPDNIPTRSNVFKINMVCKAATTTSYKLHFQIFEPPAGA